MCSAMYLSSIAVYSANSVVLREWARVSHLQWSAEGTGGAGVRVAVRGCGGACSVLDQLVLLALVKLAAVLLHEATDEVVEALVHHDVLEHRDHAFEGARIDLAAENAGRSSKDSA